MGYRLLRYAIIPLIVPASSITVSTSYEGTAIVGGTYSISCAVTKPAALLSAPDITWISPSGSEISGQINTTQIGNTTVTSVTVQFNPLLLSHSGLYMCDVSISSPALSAPLNFTSTAQVSIQSKLKIIMAISLQNSL